MKTIKKSIQELRSIARAASSLVRNEQSELPSSTNSVLRQDGSFDGFKSDLTRAVEKDGLAGTAADIISSLSSQTSAKPENRTGRVSAEISSLEITMTAAGAVDAFAVKISSKLSGNQKTRARIFRRKTGTVAVRPINQQMAAVIGNTQGRKNAQTVQMFQNMSPNSVQQGYNHITGERIARVQQNINAVKNDLASPAKSSTVIAADLESRSLIGRDLGIDLSVARDLAAVSAINIQELGREFTVSEQQNTGAFCEIAVIDMIPDQTTVWYDSTVVYGAEYSYFIVPFDSNGIEGQRSKLVDVRVVVTQALTAPDVRTSVENSCVSMSIFSRLPMIDRYEIFRKNLDRAEKNDISLTTVSTMDGFITKTDKRSPLQNGFIQVAEVKHSNNGSTFRDRDVLPGSIYLYRVYAVDVFDNKSQDAASVQILVKDPADRSNDLKRPTILAELQGGTGFINITVTVDDDRIIGVVLGRKDLSRYERSFRDPQDPDRIQLGAVDTTRMSSVLDPVLRTTPGLWQSMFQTREIGKDVVKFTDVFSRFDHTYQYSVYGVDRYGNRSSVGISSQIFVSRDPRVQKPQNLKAERRTVSGSTVAIDLSWTEGNLDIEPIELIGNQEDLANSSVRTLYQIERKTRDSDRWEQFQMISSTKFSDPVSNASAPSYRPAYAEPNKIYQYRIAALQTGSFISSYSDIVTVATAEDVSAPINLSLGSENNSVVLSWDTQPHSGPVDRWVIQRSDTAMSSVDLMKFGKEFVVYNESRRGLSRTADQVSRLKSNRMSTGRDAMFIDPVALNGHATYRVKAIAAVDDVASDWVYRSISVPLVRKKGR